MELTNIVLDEDYKKKNLDELGKGFIKDFFNTPISEKLILGIGTRLSEKSLPNAESLKNIATNSSIKLLDIGITHKRGNWPIHFSSQDIDEIEKICRFVRSYKNPCAWKLGSPISLMSDEHSELPTEKEFKQSAWELKDKLGIKITAALNQMAVQYGYNSFNAIKPYLNKNKVTIKERNHKMEMNLSYQQIIDNIEILERNSREYNDHRFSRNKERFIREDTIKNNDELVKLCNDAITYVTGTKTEYKNFKDIDLYVLKAAFLKVFDYTLEFRGVNTNYNIIKNIKVDEKVNPNDNDYFVFEFNKDYNSDLLNEAERLVQFSKEINKELISGSGKTVDTAIKLLFEKYKLRRGHSFEKVDLDELSHKVEIELENKIKVCYIGTFNKFIIKDGTYQITNILINDIELPLI